MYINAFTQYFENTTIISKDIKENTFSNKLKGHKPGGIYNKTKCSCPKLYFMCSKAYTEFQRNSFIHTEDKVENFNFHTHKWP